MGVEEGEVVEVVVDVRDGRLLEFMIDNYMVDVQTDRRASRDREGAPPNRSSRIARASEWIGAKLRVRPKNLCALDEPPEQSREL